MKTKVSMLLILLQTILFAGRIVLIEDFIASWWTSCDEVAERLENLLENNADKAVLIANHCNVDFKPLEDDKMSTSDGLARSAFYGFTYVPFATLNGSGNSATSITNSSINSNFSKTEFFSFSVSSVKINEFPKSCSTTIKIDCIETYNGSDNLVLMAAIVENNVDYFETYGVIASNGKNNYSHVLRKYISTVEGVPITLTSAGSEEYFNFTYENDETYNNYENLRIVTFIQNIETKEVIGAYQTDLHPFQEQTLKKEISYKSNQLVIEGNQIKFKSMTSGKLFIEIFDLKGKRILSKVKYLNKGNYKIPLKIEYFSSGSYIIKLSGIINSKSKLIKP